MEILSQKHYEPVEKELWKLHYFGAWHT
jgi:hypothetical protein